MVLPKYKEHFVKIFFLQFCIVSFFIYFIRGYFNSPPYNFEQKILTDNIYHQGGTAVNYTMDTNLRISYDQNSIKCYRYTAPTLTDISLINVRKGKSIFFHETSCNSYINDKIVITSRQACAVESAALLNPNTDVYLTYTSPGVFKFQGTESDRFLEALMSYDNVKIHHLNYENHTRGTPVEELYSKGAIEGSQYAWWHASDVLRYLTLWKYGGIYLDLDTVVLKNLENLPPNFSGFQSDTEVAAGIMGFQPDGIGNGHELAEECVKDLKKHFSGSTWAISPDVVTRLVANHCNWAKMNELFDKLCDNFKIFPPEAFYAIGYPSWRLFFDEEAAEIVKKATKNSYSMHVWNKLSSSTKLPINSTSAYSYFAKKYCPKVYHQCDIYF